MIRSLVSVSDRKNLHPLEIIANRQWSNKSEPAQILTLDVMTDWLAEQSGLQRYHFDPLKMDVAACTSIMSYAYASRFVILPVKVTPSEVVIAVTDPFKSEWMEELERIVSRPISTVLTNPEQLKAYLIEFYSVSKAMDGAGSKAYGEMPGNIQNLEQLIELGKAGKVDANDQHVVKIVDWLLQYAFEPARQRHPPRAAARDGHGPLSHRRRAAPGLPDAGRGATTAMTSRIKMLGRMDVVEKRRPQDGRIKTRIAERRRGRAAPVDACRPRSAKSW